MGDLTEKTRLPIVWLFAAAGFVITVVLPLAVGTLIWGTKLEAQTMVQSGQINKLEVKQENYQQTLTELQKSLVRIEVLIERQGR